ncbi:MAG: hypothetical protein WDN69_32275 [Aliidongia sp.]
MPSPPGVVAPAPLMRAAGGVFEPSDLVFGFADAPIIGCGAIEPLALAPVWVVAPAFVEEPPGLPLLAAALPVEGADGAGPVLPAGCARTGLASASETVRERIAVFIAVSAVMLQQATIAQRVPE